MQAGRKPLEVVAVPLVTREVLLANQKLLARVSARFALPLTAGAALTVDIPVDEWGNIIDGPNKARRSGAAWWKAHDVPGAMRAALQHRAEVLQMNVPNLLKLVNSVIGTRNTSAHPRGAAWEGLQSNLTDLEAMCPGALDDVGDAASLLVFRNRVALSGMPAFDL